jgi:hypothetical protein
MRPILFALLTVLVCGVGVAAGQATAAGEWQMSFVSPNGPQELTMYLTQEGPRLSGHISSEFGEYIVKGSIDGEDVKLSWSVYEQGKEVLFSVTGKLDGESIKGTIKLGNVGTGPFRAERTAGV